jgi:hypothetical protein
MVSEPIVSTLGLDGSDKCSLDPRFQEKILSRGIIRTLDCFLVLRSYLSMYEA